MKSDLAHFKRQLQAQRDAAALELRRLQHPHATPGGSTSDPASALSASMASSELAHSSNSIALLHNNHRDSARIWSA